MATKEHRSEQEEKNVTTLSPLFGRVMWMLVGPALCVLAVRGIVLEGGGWLTGFDAMLAVVVCLMIIGRWVEHRAGVATTVAGNPATSRHLRRYALVLASVAAVVWAVANVVGNHVLELE